MEGKIDFRNMPEASQHAICWEILLDHRCNTCTVLNSHARRCLIRVVLFWKLLEISTKRTWCKEHSIQTTRMHMWIATTAITFEPQLTIHNVPKLIRVYTYRDRTSLFFGIKSTYRCMVRRHLSPVILRCKVSWTLQTVPFLHLTGFMHF